MKSRDRSLLEETNPSPGRATSIAVMATLLGILACGDNGVTNPKLPRLENQPMATLEDVPFGALGGNRIAFARMGTKTDPSGLYVIDGASTTTSSYLGGSSFINPRVSPSGGEVVFGAYTTLETAWDLWVARLDGTDPRRLSETPGNSEGVPVWTPDGEWILFGDRPNGRCCDMVIRRGRPSGGIAPVLHTIPAEFGGSSPNPRAPLAASADGRIALAWNGFELLDQDGTRSSVYEVEDTESDVYRPRKAPMWSPDGGSLAFVEVVRVDLDYEATLVKRLDLATGTVTLVTEVSEPAGAPGPALVGELFSACWTPDGSTIVFTAPVGPSGYAVFAAPSSGGDATRITSRPGAVDVSVSCL